MSRRWDPERATDLRERRALYERRARSLRHGAQVAGSWRHLAQCLLRTVADLRRPSKALLLGCAVAAVVCAASAAGLGGTTALLVTIGVSTPAMLVGTAMWRFGQQSVAARRRRAQRLIDPETSRTTG